MNRYPLMLVLALLPHTAAADDGRGVLHNLYVRNVGALRKDPASILSWLPIHWRPRICSDRVAAASS